ncbi:hypothetical protein J6590_083295 [Homalodisca vitripennis]|nr:hypothetical protein J6590_083295 [Homalodisca vitripennis]
MLFSEENGNDTVHENSEDEENQLEIDIFEDTDADPNFEVEEQSDVSDDDDFSQRRQRLDYNIHHKLSHNQPPHHELSQHQPRAVTPPAATPSCYITGITPQAVMPPTTSCHATSRHTTG